MYVSKTVSHKAQIIDVAQVNQLRYNWYGTQFLCISATLQPKLYDRDGEEMWVPQLALVIYSDSPRCSATYIKGDPYIRDMKNTAYVPAYISFCLSLTPDDLVATLVK